MGEDRRQEEKCVGTEVLLSSKWKSAKVLKMFKRAKSVNGVKV